MQDLDKFERLEAELLSDPLHYGFALQSSFKDYFRTIFTIVNKKSPVIKEFHITLIEALQKIADRKNNKTNLMINVPAGSGKSLIVEYFISWLFSRDKNLAFLYLSYQDKLIQKLSRETKEICTHTVYIGLFGHVLKQDTRSRTNWSFQGSKTRAGLVAGTTGSGITGLDAGFLDASEFSGALIIDDPMDAGKIRSAVYRQEVINFYTEKIKTRVRNTTVPTILIMQRLHKDDLCNWIMENEIDDWEFIKIQALDGDKSFWEERYPIEKLLHLKKITPFMFNAQYQQEPSTEGGGVIKTEWFNYWAELPKFNKVIFTGDTAMKTKEHNDFSVFCCWGTDGKDLYLIDMIRGKWEAPQLLEQAKSFWNKHEQNGIKPTAFYIEDKASGTGLIQTLKIDTGIPIIAVQRTTDKLTRLEDVLTYIEAGRVYLPYNETHTITRDVLSECESFARDLSHKNDDIIDNICDAISKTLINTGFQFSKIGADGIIGSQKTDTEKVVNTSIDYFGVGKKGII